MRVPCSNKTAYCAACNMRKKPVGRSAAPAEAASLCDHECEGYYREPYPPTRWPGEPCQQCDPAPDGEDHGEEAHDDRT